MGQRMLINLVFNDWKCDIASRYAWGGMPGRKTVPDTWYVPEIVEKKQRDQSERFFSSPFLPPGQGSPPIT